MSLIWVQVSFCFWGFLVAIRNRVADDSNGSAEGFSTDSFVFTEKLGFSFPVQNALSTV